jgi:transglutaminase-like putative cysteine protease
MHIRIQHRTRHQYSGPVSFGDHQLFLRPLESHNVRVNSFEVQTQPASQLRWVRDPYGNSVRVCNFGLGESAVLEFDVAITVELKEANPFDFILAPYAVAFPFEYDASDQVALRPFLAKNPRPGSLRVLSWFESEPIEPTETVAFLSALNERIKNELRYQAREEEGIQTPDQTLQLGSGSCRDMAVLLMAVVRQLGLAARFVSGYLYDPHVEACGDSTEPAHLFNRAVGSMHAWAEVYLPGAGWKGFDPTNGILANSHFIPCAVSHDPLRANPIQGNYFSKLARESSMSVELKLEKIEDGE